MLIQKYFCPILNHFSLFWRQKIREKICCNLVNWFAQEPGPCCFVAKFIYFWQKRGQCTSTEKEQSKFTYLHLLGNATYRTYVMCSVVLDMTENLLYYNSMHWSCIWAYIFRSKHIRKLENVSVYQKSEMLCFFNMQVY